jgi:hypothetical protein
LTLIQLSTLYAWLRVHPFILRGWIAGAKMGHQGHGA